MAAAADVTTGASCDRKGEPEAGERHAPSLSPEYYKLPPDPVLVLVVVVSVHKCCFRRTQQLKVQPVSPA